MTRAPTAAEYLKLRSNGQWARWRAIIDKPDVIYTARATGAVTSGYDLGFDGGAGTLASCLADMTILVGSTSGGWERGICRLRKAPIAGTFYLGADPSIESVDGDYLTVLNDFAPFARHPVGTHIDVDVDYADQFSSYVPVPVIAGGRSAVISAGATLTGLDASGSWVPGSTISAYAWTFTGATSTTGTTTATPTSTYNTSGRFRWTLTLTAANSKTSVTYGWVYVLGANLSPDTGVIIEDPEAETALGWACRLLAYDRPTIKDRARVVIYSEDWYDNTAGSVGPVTGRENIVMTGWIVGETIVRDPTKDMVEFTVAGPGVFCSTVATMPCGLTDDDLPTDAGATLPAWSKVHNLEIDRGLHYLINYRSTLAKCVDVSVEDWSYPAHKLTADADNLWGQLQTFADHGALVATSDRYGVVWVQRDGSLYPVDDRAADIPVTMTLTDPDWEEELAIVRRQKGEASMAEAEGWIYSDGKVTQVGGRSPGNLPGPHGTFENHSEISFATSGDALELAGLMAGALNAEYEGVTGTSPSDNKFIDVAPRQYVSTTIDAATVKTFPRRLTLRRILESGRVALDFELEPEGGEWPAVAIEYPGEGTPPVVPPVEPPNPPPPPPVEPPEVEEVSDADAVVATMSDVRTTGDLDEASPTWTTELA